jgi:hypothetical protein|nr:MAG TPA: hypothetical protein [Caudoviricetes sp.]
MVTTVEALKNLAVVLGCAESVDKVTGTTTAEVITFIAENYPSGEVADDENRTA